MQFCSLEEIKFYTNCKWSYEAFQDRSTGRACWSCRLTCTAQTAPKLCEVGTQAMLQQLCISCQHELWNRGFTLSVLTIPASWNCAMKDRFVQSSRLLLRRGCSVRAGSCQHVRKHSKAVWPPGSSTSDACNVLDRLYLKQRNLNSPSKCFKRL